MIIFPMILSLIFSILLANLSIREATSTPPPFSLFFAGSRRPVDAPKARQIRYRHLASSMGIEPKVSSTNRQLSDSPSPPEDLTVPLPTSYSSDIDAMASDPVIQSLKDQFLHSHQDMEKKQEE